MRSAISRMRLSWVSLKLHNLVFLPVAGSTTFLPVCLSKSSCRLSTSSLGWPTKARAIATTLIFLSSRKLVGIAHQRDRQVPVKLLNFLDYGDAHRIEIGLCRTIDICTFWLAVRNLNWWKINPICLRKLSIGLHLLHEVPDLKPLSATQGKRILISSTA